MSSGSGVRDLARRAVQAEIRSVAERLFREQGYDATTVDQITEHIGMSQRTFFRHAGSKEDLVLADFTEQGEEMIDALVTRPQDESAWTSLRHAFDGFIAMQGRDEARERAKLLRSIIGSSPTLRAAYFERMEAIQRRMADALIARAGDLEEQYVLRAVVGSAFAALYAATERCDAPGAAADPGAFQVELDRIMDRLQPQMFTPSPVTHT